MRFMPVSTTDPGAFFAVSGWASHQPAGQQLIEVFDQADHPQAFEATVTEGEPKVGERYRFEEEGQTILVEITDVTRAHAGGELVVTGEVIGR